MARTTNDGETDSSVQLSHFTVCVRDVRDAAIDPDAGPEVATQFEPLRKRLKTAREAFPTHYRVGFVEPYQRALERTGEDGFKRILQQDKKREGRAGVLLDAAQAILQHAEGYQAASTRAFQEVVSDLYAGFLSAEDRRGVKLPDQGTLPPLVKWGCPDDGAYTWTTEATSLLGVAAAVVNLPPANARRGLLAWAALGHEAAGHDILGADTGLRTELADAVNKRLSPLGRSLARYWSSRIDETASDVMGILNMGQAAAIGLVGYLRGLNWALSDPATLSNDGPNDDPHPADIVRGYLAAETIRLLKFSGRSRWADILLGEANKDVVNIRLSGARVDTAIAHESAKLAAVVVATHKCKSLDGHALGEIQNWYDSDERKANQVRRALRSDAGLSRSESTGVYAAHAVSAAVLEAVSAGKPGMVFKRMRAILQTMHASDPNWTVK